MVAGRQIDMTEGVAPSGDDEGGRGLTRVIVMMAAFSLVQGLPAFFFTLGLPAILRENGVSLEVIGFTYVVWLPLAFTWLWAPALDPRKARPFGSRLNWLKVLTISLAFAFMLVSFFPPDGAVWPLLLLSLICAALGATIQIVLAAWLIENASAKQRAVANSAGVAALVLGGVLGAGLILQMNELFSWRVAVWSVSIAILLLSLPAWLIGDPREAVDSGTAERADLGALFSAWRGFFQKPQIMLMILVVICFGAAAGADSLVPAILVDKGYSPAEAGWLLGTVATGSIIPATAFMGMGIRRFGVFKILGGVYLLKAVVLVALAVSVPLAPEVVAGLSIIDYCLSGALTVATWQLFMNFADGPRTATDFSLISAMDALMRFMGGIFAGSLGGMLGYSVVFAIAAAASVGACCFAMLLRRPVLLKEQEI